MKQPKRKRLWLNDGSCMRLRPERKNHVWAYDFVQDRTHDGKVIKMLTLIDEYSRECLAIEAQRTLRSGDVLQAVADAMLQHGIPQHIRSDNGPEFIATALREWFEHVGVQTLFIEPGSPWGEAKTIDQGSIVGRTDTMKASMENYAMNCSMEKYFTHSGKHKS